MKHNVKWEMIEKLGGYIYMFVKCQDIEFEISIISLPCWAVLNDAGCHVYMHVEKKYNIESE